MLELPTFDDLATFTDEQLRGLLVAWQWIAKQPGWTCWHPWHPYTQQFIDQINAEMRKREQLGGDRHA